MIFFNNKKQSKKSFDSSASVKTSPVDMNKILIVSVLSSFILIIGAFFYFNYGYVVRNGFYDLKIKIFESNDNNKVSAVEINPLIY